ncbi:MAG: amidophosphoribosyltransferase, partial [Candidatus Heimdallarchaeota archaeon]|nr:amidophosphoribosyltransferase [Candidatus Heimdallarchaeota archaeon]
YKVKNQASKIEITDTSKSKFFLGATRYPTFGIKSTVENVHNYSQPFSYKTQYGWLTLVHNGNIIKAPGIEDNEYHTDSHLITDLIGHLIDKHKGDLVKVFNELQQEIEGSFSLVGYLKDTLFAFRDPHGIRPLSIGQNEDYVIIASESIVHQLGNILNTREVEPGELVLVPSDPILSIISHKIVDKPHRICMFEYVYFANPTSFLDGSFVYDIRLKLGRMLASQLKEKIDSPNSKAIRFDSIIPVPDTSRTAALAISEMLNIPFREAIIKNRYLPRTFIINDENTRRNTIDWKYSFVKKYINDQVILIVDDSIVRGNTLKALILKLTEFKPKEIHVAITCPAIRYPCYYGIDFSTEEELFASNKTEEELEYELGIQSLTYLSIDNLHKSIPKGICDACLSGNYPTEFATTLRNTIKLNVHSEKGKRDYERSNIKRV